MDIVKPTKDKLNQAVQLLKEAHLIAMPTETVYGLAADALNDLAVARIYEIKERPQFNPLILHVGSLEQAKLYAEFNELSEQLAKVFWPGPLTFVLPLKKDCGVSRLLTAGLETIAVRCPAHPVALELIQTYKRPLAAPSANPSTKVSPTKAGHVLQSFQGWDEPSMILDGGVCEVGLESTVLDLTSEQPMILRPGRISADDIAHYCNVIHGSESKIKAPGMMAKHYSPEHPIRINAVDVKPDEVLLAFGNKIIPDAKTIYNLSIDGNLTEAAANLFAMLHEIDKIECSGIAVVPIPEEGLGIAINDRLRRAAVQ